MAMEVRGVAGSSYGTAASTQGIHSSDTAANLAAGEDYVSPVLPVMLRERNRLSRGCASCT